MVRASNFENPTFSAPKYGGHTATVVHINSKLLRGDSGGKNLGTRGGKGMKSHGCSARNANQQADKKQDHDPKQKHAKKQN